MLISDGSVQVQGRREALQVFERKTILEDVLPLFGTHVLKLRSILHLKDLSNTDTCDSDVPVRLKCICLKSVIIFPHNFEMLSRICKIFLYFFQMCKIPANFTPSPL